MPIRSLPSSITAAAPVSISIMWRAASAIDISGETLAKVVAMMSARSIEAS